MKSRRKSKPPPPPPRRRWLIPVLALVLAAAALAIWRGRLAVPKVPEIPLQSLDATSASLVRDRLETVRRSPRSGAAWGALGVALRSFEFKPEAEQCLAVAARLDPREPRWPYLHGMMVAKRSPGEAVRLLQQAVTLCGNTPDAPRLHLAELLAELGRSDEARRELEALLLADPANAPALMTLAHLEQAQGSTATALALAGRCVNDPRTARKAWALRSSLLQRSGDADGARVASERAASLPPDVPIPDPFDQEATAGRSDARALSDEAQRYLLARQIERAAPVVQELMLKHSGFAETWLVAGRLQLLQRRPDEAERSLRRFLFMDPDSANGQFQLGLAVMEQQKLSEAISAFTAAARLKPDFGPAYFNLGMAFARSGRKMEAVAPFREAIRHNPERIDSYILLADLMFDANRRSDAVELARQAEALNPDDARLPQLWKKIGRE